MEGDLRYIKGEGNESVISRLLYDLVDNSGTTESHDDVVMEDAVLYNYIKLADDDVFLGESAESLSDILEN